MDGIINVNKPLGITSHDVVYRLRKILGIKKIGHTGTLDPDAEGVLPMCIGRGTKLAEELTAKEKLCLCEEMECNPVHCPYAKGHFDRVNDAVFELLQQSDMFYGHLF